MGIEPTTSGLDLPSLCPERSRCMRKFLRRSSILGSVRKSSRLFCRTFWATERLGCLVKRRPERSWPNRGQKIFSLPRVVPCFPLLGLTPSGLFMGLSSTIIYTSELILCSTICVPSATRHNIHIINNLLTSSGLGHYREISDLGLGLRFPCNDLTLS